MRGAPGPTNQQSSRKLGERSCPRWPKGASQLTPLGRRRCLAVACSIEQPPPARLPRNLWVAVAGGVVLGDRAVPVQPVHPADGRPKDSLLLLLLLLTPPPPAAPRCRAEEDGLPALGRGCCPHPGAPLPKHGEVPALVLGGFPLPSGPLGPPAHVRVPHGQAAVVRLEHADVEEDVRWPPCGATTLRSMVQDAAPGQCQETRRLKTESSVQQDCWTPQNRSHFTFVGGGSLSRLAPPKGLKIRRVFCTSGVSCPRRPTMLSGPAWEGPEGAPRGPNFGPRGPQDGPRNPERPPRRPEEAAKKSQDKC